MQCLQYKNKSTRRDVRRVDLYVVSDLSGISPHDGGV